MLDASSLIILAVVGALLVTDYVGLWPGRD